jgi:hypothetical protein
MKLLGHESMGTSQRYVAGAGTETAMPRQETPSISSPKGRELDP